MVCIVIMRDGTSAGDWDTFFETLANVRRRFVLSHLGRTVGGVSIDTLAREIAGWENGLAPNRISDDDYERVYVSLYHMHVPKLAESGLIEWDESTDELRLTDWAYTLPLFTPIENAQDRSGTSRPADVESID